jgi:hypothetical protein
LVRVSAACYAGTLLEKAGVDYVILEARKEPAVAYFGQALANTPLAFMWTWGDLVLAGNSA